MSMVKRDWNKDKKEYDEHTEIETLNTEKMIKGDWYRQAGYTTLVMVYMLWKALFNPNIRCLYMTPKKALAHELFNEKIRQVYLRLPLWMQCGVKMFSHNCIILGNNSALHSRAATYDNVDPSGGSWDYIFIDHFGWLRDMDMIKIANGLFPVAIESKRMHIILGASHKFGRQSPANLLFWSNNKLHPNLCCIRMTAMIMNGHKMNYYVSAGSIFNICMKDIFLRMRYIQKYNQLIIGTIAKMAECHLPMILQLGGFYA